jgi:hypothetical protein
MLLNLALELLQDILLYVDILTLLDCRRLNRYLLAVISQLPQYKRLCLLCSSTVALTDIVFGYSFLHGTNANILAKNLATAFWGELTIHGTSVSDGAWSNVANNLWSQRPCTMALTHSAESDDKNIILMGDRTYTVTAALRLLMYSIRSDRSCIDVWGINVAQVGLIPDAMSDREIVIRQLAAVKTMEQWPMAYPGAITDVFSIAECITTFATCLQNTREQQVASTSRVYTHGGC